MFHWQMFSQIYQVHSMTSPCIITKCWKYILGDVDNPEDEDLLLLIIIRDRFIQEKTVMSFSIMSEPDIAIMSEPKKLFI